MKKLLFTRSNNQGHWVGDGFPVRSIFTYNDIAKDVSPFLLMDYGGPVQFEPSKHKRGVGEHPHRGFETVTIVFAGEVDHRDSAGGGGSIGPGDVQWMTAGSGLVHEEFHGKSFSKTGGAFEMIQLWVNLPAKDKMTKPRYQGLKDANIPNVALKNNAGHVRVMAGEYANHKGPALTHTPMNLWDVRLTAGKQQEFNLQKGHTAAVFVRNGELKTAAGEVIGAATLAVFDTQDEVLHLEASEDTAFMLLSGEPIREPIVGYGPFVMNSKEEILQAFADFEDGKMGTMGTIEGSESDT